MVPLVAAPFSSVGTDSLGLPRSYMRPAFLKPDGSHMGLLKQPVLKKQPPLPPLSGGWGISDAPDEGFFNGPYGKRGFAAVSPNDFRQ